MVFFLPEITCPDRHLDQVNGSLSTRFESEVLLSRSRSEYNFTITTNDISHITNGGNPTGYYIEAQNTGTLQDTITFTLEIINVTGGLEPDKDEWNAALDKDQLTLMPGELGTVVLTVSSSCTCQEGYTCIIRVTGLSVNDPSVTRYLDTLTTYGPELNKTLVTLEILDDSVFSKVVAGTNLDFKLNLFNLDSNPQSYTLKNTGKPNGWSVDIKDDQVEVGPKSNREISITILIPDQNEPITYYFDFRAQSNIDPIVQTSVLVNLTLLPDLAINSLIPSNLSPAPGEAVKLELTITNNGPAVGKEILINLYNSTNRNTEHLINSTTVSQLASNRNHKVNFTWLAEVGVEAIVAYVNPGNSITEMNENYQNNEKILAVAVQPPKPENGGGETDDNRTDDGSDLSLFLLYSIIAWIVTFLVIIIVYIIHKKHKSEESEKTAKKIPIARGFQSQVRSREVNTPPGRSKTSKAGRSKTKTARKERLSPRDRRRIEQMQMIRDKRRGYKGKHR